MAAKLKAKLKKDKYRYRCFTFKQREYAHSPSFCLFYAPVGEVLKWSDIERLGPGVKGVQRRENIAKRKQIERFLKEDRKNTIPTAITLAFDTDAATVVPSGHDDGLAQISIALAKVAATRKPGLVIDGQHRLLGMSSFNPKMPIAVVAILDADDVEKAFQFLVINNKGSKVSQNHMKALALTYKTKDLVERLKIARIALDQDRLEHVDILNKAKDSPFYRRVKFPSTPGNRKKVVPEALERALAYVEELRLPKLDDEDLQREFFAAIWSAVEKAWPKMFDSDCKLSEKVGIICMTRYLVDAVASRADIEELDLDLSDFDDVRLEVEKLLTRQVFDYWTSSWKGSGYDTAVGHVTVVDDLKQIPRNLKEGREWSTNLNAILENSVAN
jgi:DGQHR domain-containing protein